MSRELKTVLLAEDSPEDEKHFKQTLRQAGLENPVFVVRDGDEAIAYLKGERGFSHRNVFPMPCALFLDLKMRRVSGLQVLGWLMTQESLKNLHVVVLTAFDDPKARSEAYRLGAHSFLTKPFAQQHVSDLMLHLRWGSDRRNQ